MDSAKFLGVPQQQVEGSIERNIAQMDKGSLFTLEKAVYRRVHQTDGGQGAISLSTLRDTAASFTSIVGPHTPCRKGCSHCCHMAVALTQGEADAIGLAIARTAVQIPNTPESLERAQMIERWRGVQCPFLSTEGACRIYAERPIACRLNHNISDFEVLCDIRNNPGSDVPAVDALAIHLLYLTAYEGSALGDIREFFPEGVGDGCRT